MKTNPSKLAVLWTSADREVAQNMVFMYTLNAKKNGWFDEIKMIIWGPSAGLLAKDIGLQEYLKEMIEAGVEVIACKACADSYNASEKLTSLGIDVFFVGNAFTDILKSDAKLLSV